MAKAMNAAAITEGLSQGLAHGDAHIFIGVVIIDVRIPFRADHQINKAVAADLMQHVIKKWHTGTGLALTTAIEVQAYLYIGFSGDPVDFTTTHAHRPQDRGRMR